MTMKLTFLLPYYFINLGLTNQYNLYLLGGLPVGFCHLTFLHLNPFFWIYFSFFSPLSTGFQNFHA